MQAICELTQLRALRIAVSWQFDSASWWILREQMMTTGVCWPNTWWDLRP